jgi:hypothetical protein
MPCPHPVEKSYLIGHSSLLLQSHIVLPRLSKYLQILGFRIFAKYREEMRISQYQYKYVVGFTRTNISS